MWYNTIQYNIISYVAHRLCFQTGLTCYAILAIPGRRKSEAKFTIDVAPLRHASHTDTHRDMIYIYIYSSLCHPLTPKPTWLSEGNVSCDSLRLVDVWTLKWQEQCEVRMKVNNKCLKSRFACCLFLSHCGTWEISQVCRMWHSASHKFKELGIE